MSTTEKSQGIISDAKEYAIVICEGDSVNHPSSVSLVNRSSRKRDISDCQLQSKKTLFVDSFNIIILRKCIHRAAQGTLQ